MADDSTDDEKPAGAVLDYDALANQLRSRVDLFGKALAAIATLGTGAVGLATVADLAPQRDSDGATWAAAIFALLALLAAAVAAILAAARLMAVNQPVVLDVDGADDDVGEGTAEAADRDRIYRTSASRFGLSSLMGVRERELGLRRAANRAGSDDERKRRAALADELAFEIERTIGRARWAVVRRRAAQAASGPAAIARYCVVAAGLLAFAFLSDVATAPQSDDVQAAKACGEAREAGATDDDLKGTVCVADKDDGDDPDDTDSPTADEARVSLVAALVEALDTCTSLAPSGSEAPSESRPLDRDDCAAIASALQALLAAS